MKLSISWKFAILVAVILILDQLLKIWVKTNMYIGQDINVLGNWFLLHFVENPGMLFELEFGGKIGKYFLGVFRLLLVVLVIYGVRLSIREKIPSGFVICLGLVLAGSISNIIDQAFYGLIFDTGTTFNAELGTWVSYSGVSQFSNEGYASFLQGSVVDMLVFPIIRGTYPDWFPFMAGNSFIFFRYIFNIADVAVIIGTFSIVLFYMKYLKKIISVSFKVLGIDAER